MKYLKLSSLISLAAMLLLFNSCKDENTDPKEFVFPSKVINKIVVDDAGVKWFATDKGVISYDGSKWTSYSDDKNLSSDKISDFAFEIGTGLNKLWLGSNVGLSNFDFGTSAIKFTNYNKANSQILSDTISAVGIDKSKVKYVGTSRGISIFKDGKWTQFVGRLYEEILSMYKITSIASASNGYIYATTEGGGVSRFKYAADAVSGATTFNLPWAGGLPSDTVYCVLTDNNNQWYGTKRGAALHTNEFAKENWDATYTRESGLICDSVYTIAKSSSGDIWFGTHKGISKLSGETWKNYTTKDGLVDNKINTIAFDTDGSVWIGTDKGISHFGNNKWVNF